MKKEVESYSDLRAAIKRHSGEEMDIKPYEADMRHLLNTYVQADPAQDLGNLSSLSLTDVIIKTGIHDAIAQKLNEKGKLKAERQQALVAKHAIEAMLVRLLRFSNASRRSGR